MGTDATFGAGLKLDYTTLPVNTSSSWTGIIQIMDATPPKSQRAKIETTNHDSTSKKEEFIPGFLSTSDPNFTAVYTKAQAAILQGFADDGVIRGWRITFPDGSKETFSAFVLEAGVESPLKEKMMRDMTLCISDSSITFTPAP